MAASQTKRLAKLALIQISCSFVWNKKWVTCKLCWCVVKLIWLSYLLNHAWVSHCAPVQDVPLYKSKIHRHQCIIIATNQKVLMHLWSWSGNSMSNLHPNQNLHASPVPANTSAQTAEAMQQPNLNGKWIRLTIVTRRNPTVLVSMSLLFLDRQLKLSYCAVVIAHGWYRCLSNCRFLLWWNDNIYAHLRLIVTLKPERSWNATYCETQPAQW